MQVVLITGCSSGLGRALARNFHARNFRVFASARNPESIQDLAQEGISTLSIDVTSMESVTQAIDHVVKEIGGLDVLICNAGVSKIGPVAEIDIDEIQATMNTNFLGAVRCAQAVTPVMTQQSSGVIAVTGSVAAQLVTPYAGVYGASKAAVHAIFTALRLELAPYGVHVSIIEAGAFRSNISQNNGFDISKYKNGKSLYARVADHIQARATMSQSTGGSMQADTVAEQVACQLCRKGGPPAKFLVAGQAWYFRLLGILQTFASPELIGRVLRKRMGLSELW